MVVIKELDKQLQRKIKCFNINDTNNANGHTEIDMINIPCLRNT